MENFTATEKHWVFDGPSTGKNLTSSIENIILNSIEGDIKRYKKNYFLDGTATSKFRKLETFEIENAINFTTPVFNKSFNATDSKSYFSKSQRWIGHVTEKDNKIFKAKLIDLTNNGTFEIGEFEIDEVSVEDREMIEVGSAFYWSLGYANNNGQIKKESLIRFQRFSPWTSEDFDQAIDRAKVLNDKLNWD